MGAGHHRSLTGLRVFHERAGVPCLAQRYSLSWIALAAAPALRPRGLAGPQWQKSLALLLKKLLGAHAGGHQRARRFLSQSPFPEPADAPVLACQTPSPGCRGRWCQSGTAWGELAKEDSVLEFPHVFVECAGKARDEKKKRTIRHTNLPVNQTLGPLPDVVETLYGARQRGDTVVRPPGQSCGHRDRLPGRLLS